MSRGDVMRKRAVVKHINLWPLQERRAATRDDLWPPGPCMTWLGDWVLGQIFCCLLRGLTRSPSEGWGGVRVSAQTLQSIWALWGEADVTRTFTRGTALVRHPLTLFPYGHLGSTGAGPLRTTCWWGDGVGKALHMLRVAFLCRSFSQLQQQGRQLKKQRIDKCNTSCPAGCFAYNVIPVFPV